MVPGGGPDPSTLALLSKESGDMNINTELGCGGAMEPDMILGSSAGPDKTIVSAAAWPLGTNMTTECGLDPGHLCGPLCHHSNHSSVFGITGMYHCTQLFTRVLGTT